MQIIENFRKWGTTISDNEALNKLFIMGIILIVSVIALIILFYLSKFIINKSVRKLNERFKNDIGTLIMNRKLVSKSLYFICFMIFHFLVDIIFVDFPESLEFIKKIINILVLIWVTKLLNAFLWVGVDHHSNKAGVNKKKPIKGLAQFITIALYFVAAIIAVSIFLDKSPLVFIGGLSAASAILMLVFKDTILGLIAGMQLAYNDMVSIGDWITMPKYNADGDVIDISLTTVKVKNFDNTITTIPTYNMITDSVINWRGMKSAGVRRIKKAINIDINTIQFCNAEMLERFKKTDILKSYIENQQKEIEEYNKEKGYTKFENLNGRNLSNIGVFRKYIELYLRENPNISTKDNTILMVNQRASPEAMGAVIEIYCFVNTTRWIEYEKIQSDIFDHIYTATPLFGLKIFERPTAII